MPNLDRAVANTVVWAELASPDLDGARAFYGELLGWAYRGDADPNSGYYTMAQRNGRNVAALYKKSADMHGPRSVASCT